MNLEAEIERLEAENFALREAVGVDEINWIKPEWKLTKSQARLFSHLVVHPRPTIDTAFYALYWDKAWDNKETRVVDVFICNIRKKLKKFGIYIETVWGVGWSLDPTKRQELLKLKSDYKIQIPSQG